MKQSFNAFVKKNEYDAHFSPVGNSRRGRVPCLKLPDAFISRTKALLNDEWNAFEQALQEESPTSIRLNPFKNAALIGGLPMTTLHMDLSEKVPWASDAYYLAQRPSFTSDPLFHAGCYYVQEASSMYLEQIVRKHIPVKAKVLDLCAAPGGKSTQLSSILPEKSLLVANEVIRSRSYILGENLIKWGNPHTIVTNNDPSVLGNLTGYFDVIVADVPCSGEGMFRKDLDSIAEWSVGNIQICVERQRRIVADVWSALKPGGILIYSTCTYNREENEENLDWFCRKLGAEIAETPRRFMPHQTRGEGFFIAGVRKGLSSGPSPQRKGIAEMRNYSKSAPSSLVGRDWGRGLLNPDEFAFFSENNTFYAIPSVHWDDYMFLRNRLKILFAGIALGEMKGKDFIPSIALALSNHLSASAFSSWELDKNIALKYLKREVLQDVPVALPKGYALVTYQDLPLGFIKNIGNRANNLYPYEWRIRYK
jgi:16S rRNA C967 or C1407 C5-methylase (RsmB/RsmF family)/NOL1/NOP2/fmu family ribosome biogenesis protein